MRQPAKLGDQQLRSLRQFQSLLGDAGDIAVDAVREEPARRRSSGRVGYRKIKKSKPWNPENWDGLGQGKRYVRAVNGF
jgi:hypothetical protein